MTGIAIVPVRGIPEVREGDVVADLVAARAELRDGDVLVVAQKVVSKAEGRVVEIDREDPDAREALVRSEARRIVRRYRPAGDDTRRGFITETREGFVCANAGIDFSNVEDGHAALLPLDSDRSARRIRDRLVARHGVRVGVVVADTFGRPWRQGHVNVAIGVAGVAAVVDLRGTVDSFGMVLQATEMAVADEIAGAAELVMGKADGVPAAVVRGLDPAWLREASVRAEIVRPADADLFR